MSSKFPNHSTYWSLTDRSSIVTDYLKQQKAQKLITEDVGIVVLYLKYNDPEQTLENLLASIAKQLTQDTIRAPPFLLDLYERHNDRNTQLSLTEILELLDFFATSHSKMFFIVDALDECSDEVRWDLVEKVRNLGPGLRLLITSRPLNSIDRELEDFARLEIKADKGDLELYIDHHITKNKHLERVVQKSPALRGDIKAAVVKTAEQM